MNSKIYVGNLSYQTTEDNLSDTFNQYGQMTDIIIVTDRATGRSKGFGFITFDNQEAAQAALAMDGQELDGRTIKVSLAKPPKDRRSGGAAGGGRGSRW